MTLSLLQEPVMSFEDGSGRPLSGGKLHTYAAGTLTLKATFQDQAGTIPNTNPITLNARGEATVYGSGNYRLILKDRNGVTIWDRDNIRSVDDYLREANEALDEFKGDLASADDGEGDALVGVKQPFPDAVLRTQHDKNADFVTLADFGGGPEVPDNSEAMQSAIAYCLSKNRKLILPAGVLNFDGAEFVLDAPITIEGQGRASTKLVFKGNPPKTVRTYAVWRAAYDVGDYSVSSDAPIACGFVIKSANVFLRDMQIEAYWDPTKNYPLPFNSATDYPTSNYDNAILVQRGDVTLDRVKVTGPWGVTGYNGGIKLDVTQPGGAVEHVKINDCEAHGRWGLVIEGPHGSGVAPNYADLAEADVRGAGGVSDLCCLGSQFYDTQLRLTIGGVPNKLVRRFSTSGGAFFMDGQVSRNTARRQQHVSFYRCRFANADIYTMYLNFCNRIGFTECHTEYRSGAYLTDGVTIATASDSSGLTSTVNARKISFIGGEKSGEPNNLTYKDVPNGLNLVSEIGWDDPNPSGSTPEARMVSGIEWRDRGQWKPTLVAPIQGSPTYSAQSGVYMRVGNLVYVQGRISLTSKGGLSGGIVTIEGLPFTATNQYGNSDAALVTAVCSNTTMGDAGIGMVVDNNTKSVQIYKLRSGTSAQNMSDADITDTSSFIFAGTYITEEP